MILSCPPNYSNIEMVDTAVCSESEKMREEYTRMIKHYFYQFRHNRPILKQDFSHSKPNGKPIQPYCHLLLK